MLQTKTCGRCGGSGQYSFNLMHGTMCFGCQGKGVVLATPNKKGVKRTSEFQYADVGDVVTYAGIGVCKVTAVVNGEFKTRDGMVYPQSVALESLIDATVYKRLRFVPVTEALMWGKMHRVNKLTKVWSVIEE